MRVTVLSLQLIGNIQWLAVRKQRFGNLQVFALSAFAKLTFYVYCFDLYIVLDGNYYPLPHFLLGFVELGGRGVGEVAQFHVTL